MKNSNKNKLYVYRIKFGLNNIYNATLGGYQKDFYSKEYFSSDKVREFSKDIINSVEFEMSYGKSGNMELLYDKFKYLFLNKYESFSDTDCYYFSSLYLDRFKDNFNERKDYYLKNGTDPGYYVRLIDSGKYSIISSAICDVYNINPYNTEEDSLVMEIDIDWNKVEDTLYKKYNMLHLEIIEIYISDLWSSEKSCVINNDKEHSETLADLKDRIYEQIDKIDCTNNLDELYKLGLDLKVIVAGYINKSRDRINGIKCE